MRASEEDDDADGHQDGAPTAAGLRLASCSDRSRVGLRPPAGAPPSPRHCGVHVTATERPRGRERRGRGRLGGGALWEGEGARSGRGRTTPRVAPPAAQSLQDGGRCPAARGAAAAGRAWSCCSSHGDTASLAAVVVSRRDKAGPLRLDAGTVQSLPTARISSSGERVVRRGARSPELRAGDPGTRGTREPGVRAWAAARLRGGGGENHRSLGSGSGRAAVPEEPSCTTKLPFGLCRTGWDGNLAPVCLFPSHPRHRTHCSEPLPSQSFKCYCLRDISVSRLLKYEVPMQI